MRQRSGHDRTTGGHSSWQRVRATNLKPFRAGASDQKRPSPKLANRALRCIHSATTASSQPPYALPPWPLTKHGQKSSRVRGSFGWELLLRLLADRTCLSCKLARLKEREDHIRESWVRAMEAKIVRDNMQKCYRIEGVNHNEKCKELADQYARMLRENKVRLRCTTLLTVDGS